MQWTTDRTAIGAVDTLDVDASGRFSGLPRVAVGDSITIDLIPAEGARYFGARVVVTSARIDREIRVLLIPRQWSIQNGRYAGSVVPIDRDAVVRRAPEHPGFGRVRGERVLGWVPGSYPLPVVLRHDDGSRISADDSTAFWSAARGVEEAIGARLFRPVMDTTLANRIYPVDVRVDPRISMAGITFVGWAADGNIFDASVRFHSTVEIRTPGIVEHELMHVLGFGHTAAWPSAMGERATGRSITAEDVGYAQLLMRVHDLQEDSLVVGGLGEVTRVFHSPPFHSRL